MKNTNINLNYDKRAIRRIGYNFAAGVFDFVCLIMVIVLAVNVILLLIRPIDNTDRGKFHRSGVKIVTDNLTGTEYLVTPQGHITPRLGVSP